MNLPTLEERISALLSNVGNKSQCRGCDQEIWWVTHNNGRRTPYDPGGVNHFVTCPKAKDFKR